MSINVGWVVVQKKPYYFPGALSELEGSAIKWHSPNEELSSQVFCISAFGGLRSLPDMQPILNSLFKALNIPTATDWRLCFEHQNRHLLGETGSGTPTNIDVFCKSATAVVCIKSKFQYDAREGFGGCGQVRSKCFGYYGPGSDRVTTSKTNCRLEEKDGRRGPRRYWDIGRTFFVEKTFDIQSRGDVCPFAGGNFQLMRNFLFAAASANQNPFGVLAIVPEKTAKRIQTQVTEFRDRILQEPHQHSVSCVLYESLVDLLMSSQYSESNRLGRFLADRMKKLF